MLGALAVALALTSPLPPSKPLPAVPPAEAATVAAVDAQTGTAQPAEEPASDAGVGTVPAGPPPRPRRLATRAARSEREPEPAPEPSATSNAEPAGAESVALAPIPTPRPGRAEAPGPADAAAGATAVAAAAPAATGSVEPARAATDAVPEPTDEPTVAVAPEDAASAPVPVPAERPARPGNDIAVGTAGANAPAQATPPAAIAMVMPSDEVAAIADAPAAPAPVETAVAGAAPPAPVPAERPSFIARALVAEGPESDLVVAPANDDGDSATGLALAAMPAPPERPERPSKTPEAAPVIRAMLGIPRKPEVPGFGGITPPGMICRDPRIVGAPAASFVGGIPGCGIPDPVRVESISGIRISEPALIDCRTARAFADWLTGVADPAAREALGSGIRSVSTMGSYTCRTRNNKRGERLSEHSVGRAIDIGGVTLADGRQITVRDQWGSGAAGTFLRRAWKGACGRFTTVIGPEGDRHHYNHLHLDTAYRDSTWCR